MDSKNFGFETLQIHAGQKPDATTKATGLPLYLSNAFTFDDANQAARIFALEEGDIFIHVYQIQLLMPFKQEWQRWMVVLEQSHFHQVQQQSWG